MLISLIQCHWHVAAFGDDAGGSVGGLLANFVLAEAQPRTKVSFFQSAFLLVAVVHQCRPCH